MKKIKYLIIFIFMFLFKINVNATSLNLGLSCPNTAYTGTTINCTITSTINGGVLNGINANYSFNNASYQNFNASSGWSIYNSSSNGFAIGNTNGTTGSDVGTLSVLINGSTGSTATVSIINIGASDTDYNDISASNKSQTINIIEKPIPTTTTRKKVVYLSDLSIEGYDIGFNRGTFNYTLDVGYEVSSLKINASSANGYEILGTGEVHINEGENTLVVKVIDSTGEFSNYTIKVNRVVKVSNIVNNNIEEMTNAFKSNMELVINLDKNKDKLTVTKDMLDLIKNTKRKLIYNILDNKEIIYTYTFDGNKFDTTYNDIDLTLDFKNDKKNIIDKLLSDKKMIYFKNKYNSYLPTGTLLKIKNINKYHQETRIRLYKLNEEDNLELIKSNIKIKDNFIEFEIEKGANYILSNKNTKSKNISIIVIVSIFLILLEILVIGYLLLKRKKQIELPKFDSYLENPDFIDDENN